MSLGLERAGFTVRWQVEVEPYCENVLARHWPDVLRRSDVRFAGAATLPPVDLIVGGFPCQDVSAAGRGVGIERGHRSGLWREFARIVRELRPSWVLVENVPALRSRGADIVLGDLEAAGYACWPLVVGARHVGAPHRRDRVWIVGRLADPWLGRCRLAGMADAERAERGPEDGPRHCLHVDDADRQEGAGRPSECGRALADADLEGPRTERRSGLLNGERTPLGHDADRCDDAQVADGDAAGLEGRCLLGCRRAHQWPSGPSSAPHDWEQPRTVESPLGRPAHGVSARLARARWRNELRALGNAVCPQVVEVIGRAILAVAEGS